QAWRYSMAAAGCDKQPPRRGVVRAAMRPSLLGASRAPSDLVARCDLVEGVLKFDLAGELLQKRQRTLEIGAVAPCGDGKASFRRRALIALNRGGKPAAALLLDSCREFPRRCRRGVAKVDNE